MDRNSTSTYNIDAARKNSIGKNKKTQINRRKLIILLAKILKKSEPILLAGVMFASGYALSSIKNEPPKSPTDNISVVVENATDDISENIEKRIEEAARSVVTDSKVYLSDDHETWGYDFGNLNENFGEKMINQIMRYHITRDNAEQIWNNISEKEKQELQIFYGLESVQNYKGGENNKSNYIYKVAGKEASTRYNEDQTKFLEELVENIEETKDELTGAIIKCYINNNGEIIGVAYNSETGITATYLLTEEEQAAQTQRNR